MALGNIWKNSLAVHSNIQVFLFDHPLIIKKTTSFTISVLLWSQFWSQTDMISCHRSRHRRFCVTSIESDEFQFCGRGRNKSCQRYEGVIKFETDSLS